MAPVKENLNFWSDRTSLSLNLLGFSLAFSVAEWLSGTDVLKFPDYEGSHNHDYEGSHNLS